MWLGELLSLPGSHPVGVREEKKCPATQLRIMNLVDRESIKLGDMHWQRL